MPGRMKHKLKSRLLGEISISHLCGVLKKDTDEFTYKANKLADSDNILMVTKEEKGDILGVWDRHMHIEMN